MVSDMCPKTPYGEDVTIVKRVRLEHVQKRVGTRIQTLKSVHRKKKLADGTLVGEEVG